VDHDLPRRRIKHSVASSTPMIATFLACPGASTRKSAPRGAHAWAR
jgi:hypothetical protein